MNVCQAAAKQSQKALPLWVRAITTEKTDSYRMTFVLGSKTFSKDLAIGESLIIGRSIKAEIEVFDDSVFLPNIILSRVHAIFEFDENGALSVRDIGTDGTGSRNGTYINGTKLEAKESRRLELTDKIFLGSQQIVISKVA